MDEKLEILRLLLELTKQKKLVWKKDKQYDEDEYDAQLNEQNLWVGFLYLARTDEVGSDRTLARINYGLIEDYCIGTEGFDLICEMLALCDDDWQESSERWKQKRKEKIEWLRTFIDK